MTFPRVRLAILVWLMLCPTLANAQDVLLKQPVSINLSAVSVRELIDTLGFCLNVGVSYDAAALPLDSLVDVAWYNQELRAGLYEILGSEKVEISSLPGQIVISKHAAPSAAESVLKPIRIIGKVLSVENDEPLSAVNIGIEDAPLGTISNINGEFEFVLPQSLCGKSVFLSMVGFAREKFVVPASDTSLTVMMSPSQVRLPEIRVMPQSADMLIAKVVDRRNQNYLQSSVALTGFFRELVKQDDRFVQVSEAVIEVYKPPYNESFNMERVKFVKGRKNDDVEQQMNMVQFRLQGGPFYFSRLDIMRYLDFLPDPHMPPVYKYSFLGAEWIDGRTWLRVGFMPIDDNGELLYNGEFLIDAETYAVSSVWFEMTKQTLKESRKYLIKKDSKTFKAKPYYAKYLVTYRPFRDKWMLNSVRGEIKMKIGDKKNRVNSDFTATTEMLISDLRPIDGERLRYTDTFRSDYVLADQLKEDDPDFWKDFNVIKPDEELEKVFKKPLERK